jgi:hypothetical protein
MILSNDLYENAILDSSIFEILIHFDNEDDTNQFFTELMAELFKTMDGFSERFLQIIINLKEHNYLEVKKSLFTKDYFSYLAKDISTLRNNIKFLLSGLIITSSAKVVSDINFSNRVDHYYQLNDSGLVYYNNLIQELDKVKSLEELDKFNEYFKYCLLEMSFKMIDRYIVRLNYTIQYFQKENLLIDECKDASLALELFKQQIETLKY